MKSSTPSVIIRTIVSGEVNRPTPTTGLLVSCFKPAHVPLLVALVLEAGGRRVVLPGAGHEVPQVGQLAQPAQHLLDLGALQAALAEQLIDGDAAGHGDLAVGLLQRVLEHLAQQPGAVLGLPP